MLFSDFNPWWKSAKVPTQLAGKQRGVRDEIISYLSYRQILLLFGLRRAGKTTLMYQLIDYLIQKQNTDPFHILYFSYDEQRYDLEEILEFYQIQVLKQTMDSSERVYWFIDEIQKLEGWPDKIKILYDRYPNLKIVLSGSANLPLQQHTKESLAGRFFEFCIEPLSFDEFVRFKEASVDTTREPLYENEIKILFQEYLANGGFIEAIPFDETALRKYFTESLLERVVFKDIPENFQISRPDLLFRILHIMAGIPGMYLDYKHLGNDLQADQRTIANYISYLCYSLLLTKLYNYSHNRLTSEKKLKRVYLANTGFLQALSPSMNRLDLLLENYFAYSLNTHFFYRSPQKQEIDFIVEKHNVTVPVEIKIREHLRMRDMKPLIKFMERFDCARGIVISKHAEKTETYNHRKIIVLPWWRYWSVREELSGLV